MIHPMGALVKGISENSNAIQKLEFEVHGLGASYSATNLTLEVKNGKNSAARGGHDLRTL